MEDLVPIFYMALFLAAAPVGAWYTHRHPAVRNDAWGGAFGLFFSWFGVLLAVVFCAWRGSRKRHQVATDLPSS